MQNIQISRGQNRNKEHYILLQDGIVNQSTLNMILKEIRLKGYTE